MTIPADDPRLTAYALGEMSGDERRAFEDEIAGNEALLAEVKAITSVAEEMQAELGRVAPAGLDPARRDMIMVQAKAADRARAKKTRSPVMWIAASTVGALALAATALIFIAPKHETASAAASSAPHEAAAQAKAAAAPAAAATATAAADYEAPEGMRLRPSVVSKPAASSHCDPHDPLCPFSEDGSKHGTSPGSLSSALPLCASGSPMASSSACAPFAPTRPTVPRGIPPH